MPNDFSNDMKLAAVTCAAMDRILGDNPGWPDADISDNQAWENKAADALVHIQRARNHRIRAQRYHAEHSDFDYGSMGDRFRALSRAVEIFNEFRRAKRQIPEFVMAEYLAENHA